MILDNGAASGAVRPAALHPAEAVVSWGAVWAGAAVAIALSLLLTLIASGFGLSLAGSGLASRTSLETFNPTVGAITVAIQVVSAGLGGYLAGRLRVIWRGVHGDEAHFRDTAHGLLTWAVSTLGGVILAAVVIAPYAERLAGATTVSNGPVSLLDAARAANVASQSAFFLGVGMLLSAFTAAVAARVGGMQSEAMHARFVA
jgi:hypothetical protein